MKLTIDTKIKEIWNLPEIAPAAAYFIGGSREWYEKLERYSFYEIQAECPTWSAEAMLFGTKRLIDLAQSRQQYLYDVYSDTETADDPRKKNVKLFHFPGKPGMPFVMVCAGGAFGAVCSLGEAFPVAARINELGYNVFCLNYRTGDMADKYFRILPKALDDLAAALRFVFAGAAKFAVDAAHYAVCGFSAGGHLCAEWGNPLVGYKAHGMQKPDASFIGYGVLSDDGIAEEAKPIWNFLKMVMLGENPAPEEAEQYDLFKQVSSEYPPSYFVHSRDDTTVRFENSVKMNELLTKHQVPSRVEIVDGAGHGFGLGTGTQADGWVDRAVTFWKGLQ